jgi:homoserine dehydrogenase
MKDEGIDFDTALKQAKDNGFAEADPSADINGIDAQRKISILSTIANDGDYISPDQISAEGISAITTDDMEFAASIGCDVKLIALYESGEDLPVVYVAPYLVDKSNLLYNVGGVFNAVMVDGNSLGQAMFYGQGAGTLPTASAVCGDVIEAALGNPAEARAWTEESVNITPYDEIAADIVIRADVPAKVIDAAEGYACEVLSDEAILVKSIKHKDIDSLVSKAEAKSWMHYLK